MLSSSSNSGGLRRHINHDDWVRGLATIVREKIRKALQCDPHRRAPDARRIAGQARRRHREMAITVVTRDARYASALKREGARNIEIDIRDVSGLHDVFHSGRRAFPSEPADRSSTDNMRGKEGPMAPTYCSRLLMLLYGLDGFAFPQPVLHAVLPMQVMTSRPQCGDQAGGEIGSRGASGSPQPYLSSSEPNTDIW